MKNFNFDDLKAAFGNLRLSIFEWLALGAAIAFAATVGYFYYHTTQPLNARLEYLEQQKKKLTTDIKDEGEKKKSLDEQRNNAKEIVDSLGDFEVRLRNRKTGIPAIIDEVTQLAKAHRVKADGLSFQTAEAEPLPGDDKASPSASPKSVFRANQDKMLNVYEGLGIDTTVEGDYHDLRRFISALERSRNFVIINTIALQSVDEKAGSKFRTIKGGLNNPAMGGMPQPGMPQPGMPPDAMGGAPTKTVVSLKLEMETHFARDERFEHVNKLVAASAPVSK